MEKAYWTVSMNRAHSLPTGNGLLSFFSWWLTLRSIKEECPHTDHIQSYNYAILAAVGFIDIKRLN